ncbi:MAG: hypothetical protein U0670_21480 [Anaerolineae bacterium]
MSYQERRALVSLVSTVLIIVLYSTFMLQRYPDADPYSRDVFHFWGGFFLILIPVTIMAKIVITILFSIFNTIATRQAEPMMSDERDQLVELRSTRFALYVFSLGVVVAMGSLVLDQPPTVMFMLLIGAGVVSDLVSDAAQFVYYRRGF